MAPKAWAFSDFRVHEYGREDRLEEIENFEARLQSDCFAQQLHWHLFRLPIDCSPTAAAQSTAVRPRAWTRPRLRWTLSSTPSTPQFARPASASTASHCS